MGVKGESNNNLEWQVSWPVDRILRLGDQAVKRWRIWSRNSIVLPVQRSKFNVPERCGVPCGSGKFKYGFLVSDSNHEADQTAAMTSCQGRKLKKREECGVPWTTSFKEADLYTSSLLIYLPCWSFNLKLLGRLLHSSTYMTKSGLVSLRGNNSGAVPIRW